MKRLYGFIPLLILATGPAEAGHIKHRSSLQNYFFRPQSNLYNFRPLGFRVGTTILEATAT